MSRMLEADWAGAKAAIAEIERELVKQQREVEQLKRHWTHGLDSERGRRLSKMLKESTTEKENQIKLLKEALEREKERLRKLEERLRLGRET